MTRPTPRGAALLGVALVTYLAARVLGTWELYLIALAFAAMTAVAWVLVALASRRLTVERRVTPSEPVAGEPVEFTFTVRSAWRLPGLRILVRGGTGGVAGLPLSVLLEDAGLRAPRRVTAGPGPALRGVHLLAAYTAVAEDPLGLARSRRTCGEPMRLTVAPRLEDLGSCPLCDDGGAAPGDGRPRRHVLDAGEFRGIRPHLPGEPLNRVDWKSTAKTGALMLREMEADTDDDLRLLLDGRPPLDTATGRGRSGAETDEAFETAVVAAGSMVAFALDGGHAASLFLPGDGWRELRLTPDAASRRRLLTTLAEVRPLGGGHRPSLPRLLGGRERDRHRPLVLVTSRVDEGLIQALARLRREAVSVSVVHVVVDGAAETRGGDGKAGAEAALRAAGVRCVPLAAGSPVRAALRAGTDPPFAAVRRRAAPARAGGVERR